MGNIEGNIEVINRNVFTKMCSIADTPSAEILLSNLKARFGEKEANKLIENRAFIYSGSKKDIDVIVDDEERSSTVESRDGTLSYFQPNSARWYPADVDKLKIYKVNFGWLLNAVRNAFDIESMKPLCILDERIWFIGSAWLKKRKTPIIIARNITNQAVAEQLNGYLEAKHKSEHALVLTTTKNIPVYFQLYGHSRIVDIKGALDPEGDKLAFNKIFLADKMGSSAQQTGFNNGYRTAYIDGVYYSFTKLQAEVIEVLAGKNGSMYKYELMAETSSNQDDPKSIFRKKGSYHPAWGVIIKCDNEGNYWLDY